MSVALAPELVPLSARLAPYARASFLGAAALAARLHAEEISPEHWLAALLGDEECAATRTVLHAFADPETIGVEVLALCAGIMVVGSERTLPFSVGGVELLRAARARAAAGTGERVVPEDLFVEALARTPGELRARLAALPGVELSPRPGAPAAGRVRVPAAGPLFKSFAADALRAMGSACRAAASFGRDSIGPVHVLLGCLEADEGLRARSSLSTARVRMLAHGLDEDLTPLPARALPGDARLQELLASLPPQAGTQDVLGWLLEHGGAELNGLLRRQKITPALFERCLGAFQDPPPPGG